MFFSELFFLFIIFFYIRTSLLAFKAKSNNFFIICVFTPMFNLLDIGVFLGSAHTESVTRRNSCK